MQDTRSIGVFDSGVGGLTVLRALAEAFPHESFIYLGDTARLPYGSKSPETIYRYSKQTVDFLIARDVKAVVIACNSASAHFKDKQVQGIPVYNVIEPGADLAVKTSPTGKIGVLATRATVSAHAYKNAIQKLSSQRQVIEQACPLFVPLAEEAMFEDPITNLIAYRYIQPLITQGVDTLVLGCTHYPLLKTAIQKAAGQNINLVDSGLAVAQVLKKDIEEKKLCSSQAQDLGQIQLLTTDLNSQFEVLVHHVLGVQQPGSVQLVNL